MDQRGLFGDLHSGVAAAFLRRYPTAAKANRWTEARLRAFRRRIHYYGRIPVAELLLRRIKEAPPAALGRPHGVWVNRLHHAGTPTGLTLSKKGVERY